MSRTSDDMATIQGGDFMIGSEAFYPEEGPVHRVHVETFRLDRNLVTNREFAAFVGETGYVTVAERGLAQGDYPGLAPGGLAPGSMVFTPTTAPVDLSDWRQWWRWVTGAQWRHPHGPGTDLAGLEDHPVVQVAYEDAAAYAEWAGKRLPTEAEWEYAARGPYEGSPYAWGDQPNGRTTPYANTWQGQFPYINRGAKGWTGTSPVGSFPPNDRGLLDMIGNKWEWRSDFWSDRHVEPRPTTCGCGPGGRRKASIAYGELTPRRVIKGGSHLCAPEYCLRYRPAARSLRGRTRRPRTSDSAAPASPHHADRRRRTPGRRELNSERQRRRFDNLRATAPA